MNEITLNSEVNERLIPLIPENQHSGPFTALSGQKHPIRKEPDGGD
jgi:hypothetical protein